MYVDVCALYMYVHTHTNASHTYTYLCIFIIRPLVGPTSRANVKGIRYLLYYSTLNPFLNFTDTLFYVYTQRAEVYPI